MRYLGFVTISAAILSFGLALGAASQPAAAQTAKKLKCNGCVKSKQIRNNTINSIDIRDGQVGNTDLGFDAVTGDKVLNNSLTGSDIQDGSISSFDITDDSLTDFDLAPDSVGTSEIQTNAVGSSEVATNSIPATDLSNEAGAGFAEGAQSLDIAAGVATTVRAVQISAPSNGIVIVNATANMQLLAGTILSARCSITKDQPFSISTVSLMTLRAQGISGFEAFPFALTRGFIVPTGSATYYLVCLSIGAAARIRESSVTAIFLPTPY